MSTLAERPALTHDHRPRDAQPQPQPHSQSQSQSPHQEGQRGRRRSSHTIGDPNLPSATPRPAAFASSSASPTRLSAAVRNSTAGLPPAAAADVVAAYDMAADPQGRFVWTASGTRHVPRGGAKPAAARMSDAGAQAVGELIKDTPDYQILILAVLLLWARKYGSTAWQEYCAAVLPPHPELSCLLCYSPGELPALQLPHMVEEASRQHDWARWAHATWISSASGALRRLGLADDPEVTAWALAVRKPNRNAASGVVMLPRRPVAAGEPLTVDYGFNRSSLELMADYGFVTAANPCDGWVDLPGADKLPPLQPQRLQAAARVLQRRWRRQQQQPQPGGADGPAAGAREGQDLEDEGEGEEEGEEEGEDEDEDEREGVVFSLGDSEAETDATFSGRLSAAVSLLSPRFSSGTSPGGLNSPATQRIIGGLWHKLVRHAAEQLPTTLEHDRQLLYDIESGRVSGFDAGPLLLLDPAAPRVRQPPGGARAPATGAAGDEGGQQQHGAPGASAAPVDGVMEAAASGGAAGGWEQATVASSAQAANGGDGSGEAGEVSPAGDRPACDVYASDPSAGLQPGEGGPAPPPAAADAASAAPAPHCRSGRRVGRLYAAVRARMEHKELLAMAEELLLQYGSN
ncbi:hypothetical protein GPECTOR_57g463 [Gonium pectorale]|uniref:SET domain-containing protein n=1 Tax=Gonium pectorale TaxID=33097 RepID=A0A150G5X8_GONPE|nr:hypothetical protein GPECTOR_57g463 [Gonium pectorale]|eukprot:KXZ45173.1 hypothetical protein GPECTOR_57g463 [Gonium pectorale]